MINLKTGTNNVWLSLRENLPVGITPSHFILSLTNDMRGQTYSGVFLDQTLNNKWSSLNVSVGILGDFNLDPGMYSYLVTASGSSVALETGKAMMIENIARVTLTRPDKNTKVYKR